jgi:hypothetical protein
MRNGLLHGEALFFKGDGYKLYFEGMFDGRPYGEGKMYNRDESFEKVD